MQPIEEITIEAATLENPVTRPLRNCSKRQVKVTLIHPQDSEVYRKEGCLALRKSRILRYSREVHSQGCLLSFGQLAFMLNMSKRTVSRLVKILENEGNKIPTRGNNNHDE